VPSPPQPVAELLADLARGLGGLGVRWFLFGAQAAILYGAARLTADVDVTVEAGSRSTTELVAALARHGFDLRVRDVGGFVETTRVVPLVHRTSRMPVDLVLAGPGLEEQVLARARERLIAGVPVPVVSPEDLVAMKILAGRPRDLEDVAAVVRARVDLDLAATRGTLHLLERALDRGDLVAELDRLLSVARRRPPGPRA
jgi:predicted nucleotidyltransferase